MKRQLPFLFLLMLVFACSDNGSNITNIHPVVLPDSVINKRWKALGPARDSIHDGDLVLRCGNDYISESLSDFSQQEKLYSHSGIAFINNGEMYIYSNMAGDINPREVMRRDPLDSFITPANNVAIGVYRYNLTNEELEKLRTIVTTFY